MKYFTDEKYGNNTAHKDYEDYCRSIWTELPEELRSISEGMLPEDMFEGLESIGLHDSRIIHFSEENGYLEIQLNTDNRGGLRKVWLKYSSPRITNLPSSSVLGEQPEHYHSDIMCHEIEKTDDARYSHSILFSSGDELTLDFEMLSVRFEDVT